MIYSNKRSFSLQDIKSRKYFYRSYGVSTERHISVTLYELLRFAHICRRNLLSCMNWISAGSISLIRSNLSDYEIARHILRKTAYNRLNESIIVVVAHINIGLIKFIPEDLITEEVAGELIKHYRGLRYVPKYMITPELVSLAVSCSVFNIIHAPRAFITPELAIKAVSQSSWLIHHIPRRLMTANIAKTLVSRDANAIKDIPLSP